MPNIFRTGYMPETEAVVEIPDYAWPKKKAPVKRKEPDENGFREFSPEEEQLVDLEVSDVSPAPPRELTLVEIEERYCDELADLRRKAMEHGIRDAQEEIERQIQQATEKAYQDAYQQALQEKSHAMQKAIDSVSEKLNELQLQHTQYMEQYGESLKYMAMEIAEKVMYLKIEEDDRALERLVMQTLSSIKHAEWISVDISNRLVGLAEYMQKELAKDKYEDRAELKLSDSPKDTCRISTESGTVDASVSTQLGNLKEAFENAERS